eukprot:TRINITY_DN9311_c0_g1_i1.p1 TRINITY_DN9311_c0_g1~~TRINITY_DN9311_c0_g1_i1.p1  ORF type:complete len:280 (-),score=70.57 TRINITY_DN9311_c0_g1_i1:403-1242(-)
MAAAAPSSMRRRLRGRHGPLRQACVLLGALCAALLVCRWHLSAFASPPGAATGGPAAQTSQLTGASKANMHIGGAERSRTSRSNLAAGPELLDAASVAVAAEGVVQQTLPVVSIAFNAVTFLPQYLWLLMVLAPDWEVTRNVMRPLWPVLLVSLIHLFIVAVTAATNPNTTQELGDLMMVFNPAVYLNFFNDFSPQTFMVKLMGSPGFVSEEWAHVLTWDLFVGRWVYLDAQKRGIFASHSVLFCNLIGPPGLLMHAATCLLLGKGLPEEAELPAPAKQ